MAEARYRGEVVKLDRGYPLVRLEDGELLRCEHATALVKGERRRAVIGTSWKWRCPRRTIRASSRP